MVFVSLRQSANSIGEISSFNDSFDSATTMASAAGTTKPGPHAPLSSSTSSLPEFKRVISTCYPRQTYYELVRAMQEEISIKDRTYRLKTYKQCFLGKDAVSFIQRYLDLDSREEAVEVGLEMNDKIHCWEHVCDDHLLKDAALFYRFADCSKRQTGTLAEVIKSRRAKAQATKEAKKLDDLLADSSSTELSPDDADDHGSFTSLVGSNSSFDFDRMAAAVQQETDAAAGTEAATSDETPRSHGSRSATRRDPAGEQKRSPRASRGRVSLEDRPGRSSRGKPRSTSPKRASDPQRSGSKSVKPRSTSPKRASDPQRSGSKTSKENGFLRSSTFHARGGREARRQLHASPTGAGGRRVAALKKKQQLECSQTLQKDPKQEPKQDEASHAIAQKDTQSETPKQKGSLPPRAASAPSRSRRSPRPVRHRAQRQSFSVHRSQLHSGLAHQDKLKAKEEGTDLFLAQGNNSWTPDGTSRDQTGSFHDKGHSSLTLFSSVEVEQPKSPRLEKGTAHSASSTGSNRSALLASLYAEGSSKRTSLDASASHSSACLDENNSFCDSFALDEKEAELEQ